MIAFGGGTILGWSSPSGTELTNPTADSRYPFTLDDEEFSWVGSAINIGKIYRRHICKFYNSPFESLRRCYFLCSDRLSNEQNRQKMDSFNTDSASTAWMGTFVGISKLGDDDSRPILSGNFRWLEFCRVPSLRKRNIRKINSRNARNTFSTSNYDR